MQTCNNTSVSAPTLRPAGHIIRPPTAVSASSG